MGRSRSPARKLESAALYDYALRALGRRAHTEAELAAKLSRRCALESDVDAILDRLRGHGYLDDASVAASHVSFRRDTGLLGKQRVVLELRRRGVEEDVAERAAEDAYADSDQSAIARAFARRKLGARLQQGPVEGTKEIMRLYRALVRAGFDATAIASALRATCADDELVDRLSESMVAAGA